MTHAPVSSAFYVVNDSIGLGRRFDGIGGLSGGGATSRLLVSYPEKQRDEILDLLFKPNFGASLQILKVEIGGDAQSTDGTESSHMHSANDQNYNRGYEWWLMTEAKKRNPNIKLYALSWAFPSWVGNGTNSPYMFPELTATYTANWIQGAKATYNLDIDYVGIWNERNYNSTYIKVLRATLDKAKLNNVQIVAPDGSFAGIAADVLKDPALKAAVSILGAHYPGTNSDANALATGKPLWASEDYSTFNDDVGAGCWARILNQNYVNGYMTSTISWNLIASYYQGLPYYRDGLMTAVEPWSGHYNVTGTMWISAHTTQFTKPGYHYLPHGSGAGHLMSGGSYVTFIDPDTKDFTIVIETMSHDHSLCIRPKLPEYNVTEQSATFVLGGSLAKAKSLNQWRSTLVFNNGATSDYFEKISSVEVTNGMFTLDLKVDTVTTLSTLSGQQKGVYPNVPDSMPFPDKYQDNFNDYDVDKEARYFADQSGVFEIVDTKSSHGKAMRQVVPSRPITWCGDANQPNTILGNNTWQDVTVQVSVYLETGSSQAFVAGQIDRGGCGVALAQGVFFWIDTAGFWNITSDLAKQKTVATGKYAIMENTWYTLGLTIKGTSVEASIDGKMVTSQTVSQGKGFVGFGVGGFYPALFDDFSVMAG